MTPTTLLHPHEAAERLGVHVQTLAKWARDGEIDFVLTAGRHRRYRETDLEAFMNRPAMPQRSAS